MSDTPANRPPNAGPREKMEAVQEWRQQSLAKADQYQPRIQSYINSHFQDYVPEVHFPGFNKETNLRVAISRVSGMAASLNRDLSDDEIGALTEHTLTSMHSTASAKWLDLALAGYMTWRGRNTFQFPFWKPKFDKGFSPNEMGSIFSSKKIQGAYPRIMWHMGRFTAYGLVITIMVEPLFRSWIVFQQERAMTSDGRLQQLVQDANARMTQVIEQIQYKPPYRSPQPGKQEDSNESQQETSQEKARPFSIPFPTPIGWSRPADTNTSSGQSQSEGSWDVLDDDDDASPLSSSARSQPASSSGSAWDRLRQQSAPPGQQQAGSTAQGSWASVSQPQSQAQQSSWEDESSSSDNNNNNYTFSSADREGLRAKDQAQREFDAMLERERRGTEQSNSWGRG